MQTNVNSLLSVATASTEFNTIADQLFEDTVAYPAFAVGRRKATGLKPLEDLKQVFEGKWRYEVFILVKESESFTELERITDKFVNALPLGAFIVSDADQFQARISGDEVKICALVIEQETENIFNAS